MGCGQTRDAKLRVSEKVTERADTLSFVVKPYAGPGRRA